MIKKKRKFVAITTLIDKGIVISGDTTYTGGIRIDGKIKGNLKVHGKEDSLLIMGDGSKIVGNVEVEKAIINGEINGLYDTMTRLPALTFRMGRRRFLPQRLALPRWSL